MLAQGRFAPCQGQGCPSYESPTKSCSPHKEGMFWSLEGLAATGIQEARSPAQQERPPPAGLAFDRRGKCCPSAGGRQQGQGQPHLVPAPWGWFLLCPCFVTQGEKVEGL